ncbi:MAG: ABC transporter permease [Ferruginibacter sp.]
MFHNYFKTAWRNLRSRKTYAFINIFGLAVGIATSLVIFLVVHYEMSYDNFQSRKERIARVVTTYSNQSNGEVTSYESGVPAPLPNALRTDFPQLEKVAAVWNVGGAQIHIPVPGKDLADEKRVKVSSGLFFAEPSIFEIFDYDWLAGNAAGLKDPNMVVLSQSLANEFFGDWKKAVGQTIQMWSFRVPLQVIGVYKDLPANTDMEIKMGASFATFRGLNADWFASDDWEHVAWSSECFLLLPEKTNGAQFRSQLAGFVNKYFPKQTNGKQSKISLAFQPLTDMHLNENHYTFKGDALTRKELWSLALIGFFLLLVACINFINLATAQSITRAKEIGVRKVLGSSRSQILQQFLNETALITLTSLVLGYLLAQAALPFISNLMGKPLSLNLVRNPSILLFLVILGTGVNFLAGFYPGMILSGFNPIVAIKNKISTSSIGGISLRRGLVVVQFVIAQLLIIGTIVVIQQMKFFRNQPMGFDKNAVAFIELPSDSTDQLNYNYLKAQMLKVPGVDAASFCLDAPASFGSNNHSFYFNSEPTKKDFSANLQFADTGYLNTFRIGLLAGRVPYPSDTMRELLVNETMVKMLGLKSASDIIGKTLSFDSDIKLPVVGVMHDFNSKSLKEAVAPFVLATNAHGYNFISLRLDPTRMATTLELVQKVFTGTYPTYMYDLSFLDERIALFYKSEALASQLFKIAAFLAIFISCLGLYGLISFMAVQKTREVGIRKVLGATVQNIVFLFSREFTLLIGIAFLIAAPVGYFLMDQWLSGFFYHIKLGWAIFALSILISVIIAWLTVGYKAVSAAVANPVKSLRTE